MLVTFNPPHLLHPSAAIFNEYIWFPSHGDYKGTGVTSRVMDRLKFMNSKTLFKL